MPEQDDAERDERDAAVEAALRAATEVPLELVATLVDALRLAAEVEPLVKPELVSDVLAGADILRGAARAALRAVDLDLDALESTGSRDAQHLRARRDELVAALDTQR
jgi:formiminotetrahydrofolate cyclodeaminase